MNIKVKIGLLLLVVMSISCEEFLEEEPPTFISASNFFQNAGDARTAADGVYKSLLESHNRFTVTPSDRVFEQFSVYSNWWIGIGRANTVIANVPAIDMDETEKNIILGETRALRAFYYYQLVRAFGDQPLILDEIDERADFEKPRLSAEEIYDQVIIPDLQFAEENCADELHTGRITKWTAKLILSEV